MSLLSTNTANDIWSSGAFSFESPLKDLLDSGNYTLELLLREDELLQEVKGMHPLLISYLSRVDSCRQLLDCLVSSSDIPNDSDDDSDDDPEEVELRTIKYPYMACEVICCEIAGILDTIVDHVEEEEEEEEEERGGGGAADDPLASTTNEDDDDGERQERRRGDDDDTTAAAIAAANDAAAAAAVEVSSVASCDGSGVVVDDEGDAGGRRCLLDLFFGILERDVLDDRLAGYFEKILTILFQHRPATLQSYISSRGLPLLKLFFHHLSSHSITQILLRLLLPYHHQQSPFQYNPPTNGTDAYSHPTIQSCFAANPNEYTCLLLDELKSLRPCRSIDVNRNAAEILILAIRNDESHHVVEGLLRHDFLASLGSVCRGVLRRSARLEEGGAMTTTTTSTGDSFVNHESRLTCFLSVFEVILRCFFGKDEHHHASSLFLLRGHDAAWDDEMMTCIHLHDRDDDATAVDDDRDEERDYDDKLETILPLFAALLTHSSTKSWNLVNQTGNTQGILGYSRLCIVKCLNALVLLDNPDIDALLIKNGLFKILLDLFFEFEWSSVLHTHVSSMVTNVLNGGTMRYETQAHLIVDCKMLDMIMEGFRKESEFRLGYIGHLIVISQSMQNILRKDAAAASEDDDVDVVNVEGGVGPTDGEMMHDTISEVDIEQRLENFPVSDFSPKEEFPAGSSPQVIQGHFTSRDVEIDILEYQDEEASPTTENDDSTKETQDEEFSPNQTNNSNSDGQESHDDDSIQTTTITEEDSTPKLDTPPTDETPTMNNDNLSEQESTNQPPSTPPPPPSPPPPPATEEHKKTPTITNKTSNPPQPPTETYETPSPPTTNFLHPPTASCDTTTVTPTLPQLVRTYTPGWISFVTSTLQPMVQIQSTPLGNTLPPHPHEELSMTETDYDVAASMIDSLATESLPFGSKIDYHPEGNSHDFIYGEDDDDDDDDDDDVPVIDLFAGNFDSKPRPRTTTTTTNASTTNTTTVESIVDRVEREAQQVLECEDDDSDEEEEEEEDDAAEMESPARDDGEGRLSSSSSSPPEATTTTARWATFEGEDLFDTPAGQCFEAEFPSFDDDDGNLMNGESGGGNGESTTNEGGSKDKTTAEDDPFGDVGRRLKIDELF